MSHQSSQNQLWLKLVLFPFLCRKYRHWIFCDITCSDVTQNLSTRLTMMQSSNLPEGAEIRGSAEQGTPPLPSGRFGWFLERGHQRGWMAVIDAPPLRLQAHYECQRCAATAPSGTQLHRPKWMPGPSATQFLGVIALKSNPKP